jgi:hypothetical protein
VSIAILPLPIKGGRLKAMSCLLILDLLKLESSRLGLTFLGQLLLEVRIQTVYSENCSRSQLCQEAM